MKDKILILTVFALFSVTSSAQQVPQFSQNMFNKLANNPAISGSSDFINAGVLHRSQWMGFTGAPITLNLAVERPVEILNGGIGLNIVSDAIASYDNIGVQFSYAYQTSLGDGQLGIGASAGMYQSALNGSELKPSEGGDNTIPTSQISGSSPDFGAGLYYNTQDVYIGLSTLHITEPSFTKSDGDIINLSRHYFLLTGYYYEISPELSLNPSIYLKSDGSTSQIDINTNIIYNNKMWGGVSYRNGDNLLSPELVFLTGMKMKSSKNKNEDDLQIGIAYDVVLSDISNNTLEFMIGYSFKIEYDRPEKSYKNPRYL